MFYHFSLVRFVSFCDITFVFEPEFVSVSELGFLISARKDFSFFVK